VGNLPSPDRNRTPVRGCAARRRFASRSVPARSPGRLAVHLGTTRPYRPRYSHPETAGAT
jgi:hypothetical protein